MPTAPSPPQTSGTSPRNGGPISCLQQLEGASLQDNITPFRLAQTHREMVWSVWETCMQRSCNKKEHECHITQVSHAYHMSVTCISSHTYHMSVTCISSHAYHMSVTCISVTCISHECHMHITCTSTHHSVPCTSYAIVVHKPGWGRGVAI